MPTGVTHWSEKTQRCHFFATVGAVWIGLYREPGGNIIRRVSPFHGDQSPGQLLRPEQLMCQSPHPLGPSPHTWMTWKREHCHSHLEKKSESNLLQMKQYGNLPIDSFGHMLDMWKTLFYCTLIKIKVLYWHQWFSEKPWTSMEPFNCRTFLFIVEKFSLDFLNGSSKWFF